MLLKHGANPRLGSNDIGVSNSCVHAAAMMNDAAAMRLLLSHGSPHSGQGKGGWTPLGLAARAGAVGVIKLLLAAGADPDVPMPMGKSARELAMISKRAHAIEAFTSAS